MKANVVYSYTDKVKVVKEESKLLDELVKTFNHDYIVVHVHNGGKTELRELLSNIQEARGYELGDHEFKNIENSIKEVGCSTCFLIFRNYVNDGRWTNDYFTILTTDKVNQKEEEGFTVKCYRVRHGETTYETVRGKDGRLRKDRVYNYRLSEYIVHLKGDKAEFKYEFSDRVYDDFFSIKEQLNDAPIGVKKAFNEVVRYFDNRAKVSKYEWEEREREYEEDEDKVVEKYIDTWDQQNDNNLKRIVDFVELHSIYSRWDTPYDSGSFYRIVRELGHRYNYTDDEITRYLNKRRDDDD